MYSLDIIESVGRDGVLRQRLFGHAPARRSESNLFPSHLQAYGTHFGRVEISQQAILVLLLYLRSQKCKSRLGEAQAPKISPESQIAPTLPEAQGSARSQLDPHFEKNLTSCSSSFLPEYCSTTIMSYRSYRTDISDHPLIFL